MYKATQMVKYHIYNKFWVTRLHGDYLYVTQQNLRFPNNGTRRKNAGSFLVVLTLLRPGNILISLISITMPLGMLSLKS